MDAGIIDTLNRQDARRIAEHLDALDVQFANGTPWYRTLIADAINGPDPLKANTIVSMLAVATSDAKPGTIRFDDSPAGDDWENLISNFRAEIQARRATHNPHPGISRQTEARVV